MIGDEPIWHKGEVVGWVTSGGYAHHSEVSVAMGYVPAGLAESDGPFEIEIIGKRKT
ncbi:MAG: glycine cleavage T C-terminal barrel domain-containing protein, partial [Acidimicrobiales bacterium]